jgi:dihydrofolate reductase
MVTIIVARARNGVIGRDNTLPWHLPEDLQHFKRTTMHHPVLMGRRTYESIGHPLPGRRIIVVSRNPDWSAAGCERSDTLATAIELAGQNLEQHPGIDPSEIFVAGGARLYHEALTIADRLIVTAIDNDAAGDVHFPAIDPAAWRQDSTSAQVSKTGLHYAIETWRRMRPAPP